MVGITGPEITFEWPLTISHRVDQIVERHESATALKDGLGNSMTYGQMADRVQDIAASLVAAGAGDGSPVGVFQSPSADWICSLLAVLRVGATYVPLDLRNSIDRLATIAELVRPVVLLTDASTSAKTAALNLSDAVEIVVSDLTRADNAAVSLPHVVANQAKPESTAIMLFTSGTSGQPKGVLLTHENLRAQIEGHSRFGSIPSQLSVVLQQSIYSFDMSLDQIFAALANGGCLVIVSAEKRGDPESITALMAEHGVTYTLATPSEYDTWFCYARENLARCKEWQVAFAGGEHLRRGLIEQFADIARDKVPALRLFNIYGPTEVTVAVTRGEVKHSDAELKHPVSVGFVMPNYRVAVVDKLLHPAPVGVAGEICVGGPAVARGYLSSPGVTQDSFISGTSIHPSLATTSTWYRTGDLGVLRENGAVDVLGRIAGDSQVKIRGFRVELQEVEAVLLAAADGALSHAAVTVRGSGENRFLAAHAVFAPDVPHDRHRELVQLLESRLPLPSYMQPAVVVPIDSIPLTQHLKLDRTAIQAMPLPDKPEPSIVTGPTVEARLAELWRRVISHNIQVPLTPEIGFFEVGGTSILLVKLRALVKAEFNSAPRLADLINYSTLGGMAKVVESCVTVSSLDWQAETCVPESVSRLSKKEDSRFRSNGLSGETKGTPLKIILSGATGYLGRHLLARLVSDPRVGVVYCLVRNLAVVHEPGSPSSVEETFASPKVKLVQADLSQPSLGLLADDDFDAVVEAVAAVVHCAADRSFFENYESLQAVNVNSVKELARFALLAGGAPLHFVSSGAVTEYEGATPPTDGTDGYVASKWAAETFLRKAAPLGLRSYLHRPLPLPSTEETADGTSATGQEDGSAAAGAILDELVSITQQIGTRPDFSAIHGHVDVAPVERVVDDMAASIFSSCAVTTGDLGEMDPDGTNGDAVQVVRHVAQQRLPVEEFVRLIEKEEALRLLPTMDPLVWFGEAKRAGFGHFMTAQHLVISSREGKLVTRR